MKNSFLSDYLTDLYTGKNKKQIRQICPQSAVCWLEDFWSEFHVPLHILDFVHF